ncbi:cell division protein FtsL [Endozoicomonadaceae bacterium StTr2]
MDLTPLRILARRTQYTVLVMGMLVIVSAVAVVYTAHVNRVLQNALQTEVGKKNRAQVEWGQLLLQHSTLTSPSRIDRLARERLGMEAPSVADTIVVKP